MLARFIALLAGGLLAVCLASPAEAIVAYGDDSTTEAAPTGSYDLPWDYVYPYKGSSAVAVALYWLLTARHVADDAPTWSMTLGATTYTEQQVVYHDDGVDPANVHDADLALVRVDHALPGYYDRLSTAFASGIQGVMVGYGYEEGVINASGYKWLQLVDVHGPDQTLGHQPCGQRRAGDGGGLQTVCSEHGF